MRFSDNISPSSRGGFAGRVERNNEVVYALWTEQRHKNKAFLVIKVARNKHIAFEHMLKSGNNDKQDLASFGEILHHDWQEPHDDFKQMLRDAYGLDLFAA